MLHPRESIQDIINQFLLNFRSPTIQLSFSTKTTLLLLSLLESFVLLFFLVGGEKDLFYSYYVSPYRRLWELLTHAMQSHSFLINNY